jgi:DNA-binding response OmpR family regulator
MKILLVEDDLESAKLFSRILQTEGYEVVHTTHAFDGLVFARQTTFDAIILDINLPDLDGKTVGLSIRRSLKDVPIIALTAQADAITRELTRRYGFSAFIAKPCTDEDLVNTVRQLTQATTKS